MLAGRSQRTALHRGDPFPFEQRDTVLAHERFLTQPDSVQIGVPIFTRSFSYAHLLLRLSI